MPSAAASRAANPAALSQLMASHGYTQTPSAWMQSAVNPTGSLAATAGRAATGAPATTTASMAAQPAAQPFVGGQPLVLQSWAPGYNFQDFGGEYGYVLAGQPIPSAAQAAADVNALQGTQYDPSVNPLRDPYVQAGRRDPVTNWGGRDPVTGYNNIGPAAEQYFFGVGGPAGQVSPGLAPAGFSPGDVGSPGTLGAPSTQGAPSAPGQESTSSPTPSLAAQMGFTGFSPSPAGVVGVAGPDGPTQAQVDQAIADLTSTLGMIDATMATPTAAQQDSPLGQALSQQAADISVSPAAGYGNTTDGSTDSSTTGGYGVTGDFGGDGNTGGVTGSW